MKQNSEYFKDVNIFMSYKEHNNKENLFVDEGKSPIIKFENVYFSYPDTKLEVLKGVTFEIREANQLALVGYNGSGKSTIVKLILGLYKPDSGSVTINNIPAHLLSKDDIKNIFSVVFQDFAKYQISFENNIYLNNMDNSDKYDLNKIVDSLDLQYTLNKLPKKEKTILGKEFENGIDISLGEWQKLAFARSLASQSYVYILDEPTAALDPLAESELYEKFKMLMKNKSTLLISHRLGSTKMADTIIVLNDGKIIESGTHNELIDKNGLYCEMFEAQKKWYSKLPANDRGVEYESI